MGDTGYGPDGEGRANGVPRRWRKEKKRPRRGGRNWGIFSRRRVPKPPGPYHYTVRRVVTRFWTTWLIDRSLDERCSHGDDGSLMWCFRDVRNACAFVLYMRRKAALLRREWGKSEQVILTARAELREKRGAVFFRKARA